MLELLEKNYKIASGLHPSESPACSDLVWPNSDDLCVTVTVLLRVWI